MDQPISQQAMPQPVSKRGGLIGPDGLYKRREGQNLITPITVVSTVRMERRWKSMVVSGLAVISAALFSYLFLRYLVGDLAFWYAGGALLLWGALVSIDALLHAHPVQRVIAGVLQAAVLVGFYYTYSPQALFLAGGITVVFLLAGYFSVHRELSNSIEIRFFAASSKMIRKAVTAAILFMIIMYAALAYNNGNFFLSKDGFALFFNWATGFVNDFYPKLSLTGSFGDFTQAVARMQLEQSAGFSTLTPAQQSSTLLQAEQQVMTAFTPSTSSLASLPAPSLSDSASVVFYRYFVGVTNDLKDRFGQAFVGIWSIALFLILRMIGIIVVWIDEWIALALYEVSLATGFTHMREETTTRQVVEY